MKRHLNAITALTVVLATSVALVSCSSQDAGEQERPEAQTQATQTGQWPRTVETDDGNLEIEAQPQRIVSTSTTLTGSLLALGAPVVASGATKPNIEGLSDDQGFFNQYSEEAKAKGVEKLWSNSSPNPEDVLPYEPDLIIVSKNGGDSAYDQVDQLRKIAPVMVVDYTKASWQDVTTMLAKATGKEDKAKQILADFDQKVDKVAKSIKVPDHAVSPLTVFGDGSGAAALTHKAAQSQLLERLGFTLTDIPEQVKGDTSMGKSRGDIVQLSLENVQKGLPGESWIVVAGDKKTQATMEKEQAFNTSPAYKNKQVYFLPGETFRLDYFSAQLMLDSLAKQFAE
ncbi:Fe2+-enterobactin ABC transporter substrate-binding protein [Corynebacterium simulans]|uniref:Fe2+-enterobactin ABC transporter substrate-binding protein n=1 Tax=Corynebacterium simulans TaxID=146827 RepID=UPI000784A95A|nr:Fe2+-enterobactin ABC transporter substrate-binding protein [Corynebacterium simulans]MDK7138429.1 Fe2+-enterobactin ABC transporter substrate-binding protein [Corynebacterium simulans]